MAAIRRGAMGLDRLLRLIMHIAGALLITLPKWPRLTAQQRAQEVQGWAAQTLAILGVSIQMQGQPCGGACIVVANHVSWLDIVLLHAVDGRLRFIAKAEIARWPLVGKLAGAGNTLFIERESRRDAARMRHALVDALNAGDALGLFPEGTTGPGYPMLHWHANLLQAAIDAAAPVQPVALIYALPASGAQGEAYFPRRIAYIDDDHLLGSLWRVLTTPALTATLHFLPPVHAEVKERRLLAGQLHDGIAGVLACAVGAAKVGDAATFQATGSAPR